MRLWTLHPKYLDAKGLVALWREALLAQKVLRGKTKGYRHHPQLIRFQAHADPVAAMGSFLKIVFEEATRRGYEFDGSKIAKHSAGIKLSETKGQLLYEWKHLRKKLEIRAPQVLAPYKKISIPEPHPIFKLIAGGVREWEIVIKPASSAKPRVSKVSARQRRTSPRRKSAKSAPSPNRAASATKYRRR
jgi:Pyrimidine dimer DNA glycosylase